MRALQAAFVVAATATNGYRTTAAVATTTFCCSFWLNYNEH